MIILRLVPFISYALLWLQSQPRLKQQQEHQQKPPRKRQIMFTVPNTQRTQYNWAANRFDTIPDSNQIISLTHIICHFKKGLANWRSFASFWWIEKFLCHNRHHRVEKTTKTTILCSNRFFAQQTRRLRLWYLFNTNECFPSPVHCTRKCFQK